MNKNATQTSQACHYVLDFRASNGFVPQVQVWNYTWPHSNNRWGLDRKTSTCACGRCCEAPPKSPWRDADSPLAHSCVHHQKLPRAGRSCFDQSPGFSVWACIQQLVYVGVQCLAQLGKPQRGGIPTPEVHVGSSGPQLQLRWSSASSSAQACSSHQSQVGLCHVSPFPCNPSAKQLVTVFHKGFN